MAPDSKKVALKKRPARDDATSLALNLQLPELQELTREDDVTFPSVKRAAESRPLLQKGARETLPVAGLGTVEPHNRATHIEISTINVTDEIPKGGIALDLQTHVQLQSTGSGADATPGLSGGVKSIEVTERGAKIRNKSKQSSPKAFEPVDPEKEKLLKLIRDMKKINKLRDIDVVRQLIAKRNPGVIKRKRLANVNPLDVEELLAIMAEDPNLVAAGMEKDKLEIFLQHVGELRRYYQSRKAHDVYTYLNTETAQNKRDYEEMWFRAR